MLSTLKSSSAGLDEGVSSGLDEGVSSGLDEGVSFGADDVFGEIGRLASTELSGAEDGDEDGTDVVSLGLLVTVGCDEVFGVEEVTPLTVTST